MKAVPPFGSRDVPCWIVCTLCLAAAVAWPIESAAPAGGQPGADPVRRVSRGDLREAMLAEKSRGYNLLATANGARFSSGVILHLARRARDAQEPPGPLLIDHQDYFEVYLEVMGLQAAQAPTFMSIANEYGEDQYIEPRRERVIERIVTGPEPVLAVLVVAGWPAGPGVAKQYSYADDKSTPPLRVTHQRINSYRILDFGDVLLYDDIQGVTGRATAGLLGLMFKVIGDGRAVKSFIAYSRDGLQVTRTTARKGPFSVTQTATVGLDGRAEKGLPPKRPDLEAIETRLKQPFEASYVPLGGVDPAKWRAGSVQPLARPRVRAQAMTVFTESAGAIVAVSTTNRSPSHAR